MLRLLLVALALVLSSQSQVNLSITLENVRSLQVLQQATFADATLRDLVFHPDSEKLVTAIRQRDAVTSLNGQVVFLNTQNLQPLSLADDEIVANTFTFSPDGTLFAIGTEQGKVSIFNTRTLEPYVTLQLGIDIINDLAISPDNQYLGATFAIPTIMHEGDLAFQLVTLPDGEQVTSHPRETDIYGGGVAFDDRGQFAFFSTNNFATNNGRIYVREIATGIEIATSDYNASNSRQLIYNAKKEALYYIGSEGIRVTFPFTNEITCDHVIETSQEGETPTNFAVHPDDPLLAVGYFVSKSHLDGEQSLTNAGVIRFYNSETGEALAQLDAAQGAITNLAFSPDGTLLASGSSDGTVRLWGIPAGE